MIDTLAAHDVSRAWVVHGGDGLDELSTTTVSQVLSLEDGAIRTFEVDPVAHGIERATMEQLRGGPPAENAAIARALLDGKPGPVRAIVTLNAGAALVVAGRVATLDEGISIAGETIDDGRAAAVLERFVIVSQDAAARLDAVSAVVRVPASSANLGPGFDTLGMALGAARRARIRGQRDARRRP